MITEKVAALAEAQVQRHAKKTLGVYARRVRRNRRRLF
jgi:hypothetical protein